MFEHIDPQALIILVVMIVGALRWFLESRKKKGEIEEEPTAFEDLYEEARREILERQHQAPAPPVAPTPPAPAFQVQATPAFVQAPAPGFAPTVPPPLPSSRGTIDYNAPRKARKHKLSSAEQAALERVRIEGLGPEKLHRSRGASSGVRRLLATPGAARDAIVLREILGPPKGAD